MEKLAAESEAEPEVSPTLLIELNTPDADDERAERPEEEVTQGIEQAVALATDSSRGSQQISPEEIAILDRMAEIASQSRRLADPRLTDAKRGLIPWLRNNLLNPDGTWNNRRVLIFTEFTETKTYLRQQFDLPSPILTVPRGASPPIRAEPAVDASTKSRKPSTPRRISTPCAFSSPRTRPAKA